MTTEPWLLSGRYSLGDLLGSGGTASVFRARDTLTDDIVAIKILHPAFSESEGAREALFAEAMAVASIDHPNIVRVDAVGVHEAGGVKQAWIAEELAPGVNLGEHLASVGRMPARAALAVADGVLRALETAHAAGLVHRDISPSNIIVDPDGTGMLTPDDVRLVDFGLADVAGRSTLGTSGLLEKMDVDADNASMDPSGDGREVGVVGNVNYLSPEQARGGVVGPQGDLYQLGAVIYTMVTGAVPYPRATPDQTMRAHISAPPPVPSALVRGVPRDVDRLVARSMVKSVDARYPSATVMLADVRRAVAPVQVENATLLLPAGAVVDEMTTVLGSVQGGVEEAAQYSGSAVPSSDSPARRLRRGPRVTGTAIASVLATVTIVALLVWGVAANQIGRAGAAASASASASEPVRAEPSPTTAPTRALVPTSAPTSTLTPTPTMPAAVSVPTVTGLSVTDASRAITESGLTVAGAVARDAAAVANAVLGTDPEGGLSVAPGTAVTVFVASGSNVVPLTAGMSAVNAAAIVQGAGFSVGNAATLSMGAQISGTIPTAGSRITVGSIVTLTVAATPSPTPSTTPSPASPTSTPAAG